MAHYIAYYVMCTLFILIALLLVVALAKGIWPGLSLSVPLKALITFAAKHLTAVVICGWFLLIFAAIFAFLLLLRWLYRRLTGRSPAAKPVEKKRVYRMLGQRVEPESGITPLWFGDFEEDVRKLMYPKTPFFPSKKNKKE